MSKVKIGIIKEGKIPVDKRLPLTPKKCVEAMQEFPELEVVVQPSEVRCFKDAEYEELEVELQADLTNCDVLMGVKEVPVDALIPNKKYFFFSHTIKKQAYNRKLLIACLEKNIELIDHETIVDHTNHRVDIASNLCMLRQPLARDIPAHDRHAQQRGHDDD